MLQGRRRFKASSCFMERCKLVNRSVTRCNDNVFVFNIMLSYNTEFYDIRTKDWYRDKISIREATCYIKFSEDHFEYIQHLPPDNKDMTVINIIK